MPSSLYLENKDSDEKRIDLSSSDSIAYEEAFFHHSENTTVQIDEQKLLSLVPKNEKRAAKFANIIGPLVVSSTPLGIMSQLIAPVSAGGAGLIVSSGILIGLTAGIGIICLVTAYAIHTFWYNETIKEITAQIQAQNDLKMRIYKMEEKIQKLKRDSFILLLQMKIELKTMDEKKENEDVESLENQMNQYIKFLVGDTYENPRIKYIKNPIQQMSEKEIALKRQEWIIEKLQLGFCAHKKKIQNELDIIAEDAAEQCFPKIPFLPAKKPVVNSRIFPLTAFLAFGATFGLSFSVYGTILGVVALTANPFTAPVFVILCLSLIFSLSIASTVYYSKKKIAEREAKISDSKLYLNQLEQTANKLEKGIIKTQQNLLTFTQTKSKKKEHELENKNRLLEEENVKFRENNVLNPSMSFLYQTFPSKVMQEEQKYFNENTNENIFKLESPLKPYVTKRMQLKK